jgi:hypothetical protein
VNRRQQRREAEQVAARYLWELLRREEDYRAVWLSEARQRNLRLVPHEVNEEAVRSLVTRRWFELGELPRDSDPDLAKNRRTWKDRINRLARGEQLSAETLEACIAAFDMPDADADRLRALHAGQEQAQIIRGALANAEELNLPAPEHSTFILHEYHYLGPDGLPERHETIQCIRSQVDGLSCYPYRFDTPVTSVAVLHGGQAAPVQQVHDGLWEAPIRLTRRLQKGETASLRYLSVFACREPLPSRHRRVAYRRVDSLELYVRFHSLRVPAKLWWSEWDNWSDNAELIRSEPVELDAELSAHRALLFIEQAVVGYRWEW